LVCFNFGQLCFISVGGGGSETIKFMLSNLLQPCGVVTITEYGPEVETGIVWLVAPVFHK
jgi:hypothetical protein